MVLYLHFYMWFLVRMVMRRHECALIVILLVVILLCCTPLALGTDDWAMFRQNLNHSGTATSNTTTNAGKLLWNYTTGSTVYSSPAVAYGCIFIGSKDGYIYCLNASSGQKIWARPTGQEVVSSPAVDECRVFVGSDDGWFYCLNASTGYPFWIKWIGWNAMSSPAVLNGRVYVGSGHHDVVCFNASDGSEIWRYATSDPVVSSPAIADGIVYVSCDDFAVHAINASTGERVWRTLTGSADSSPCIYEGYVYVGSYQGYVFCLNAYNGTIMWGFQTPDTIMSSPAVTDGCVFIGSEDNSIYCINASNGHKIWQTQTGYWVCSSPAVVGGNVYVGSDDYNLYCLNASTGAIKWTYQTGNQVKSSPAIVNDTLYFGSFDNRVYALTLYNSTSEATTLQPTPPIPAATIAVDVMAVAIGAAITFATVRFIQSTQRRKTNQTNNSPNKKTSWLKNHGDALCLLVIMLFTLVLFVNLGRDFLWAADEQTYSQMAAYMIKTGDYLTPSVCGELGLWVGKPPLLMWLTSLSYQAFGITNFAARFWVPIFGGSSMLVVFFLGKKLYNRAVGLLSALVLGTFTTFYTFATHAMTDVPLVFFIVASLYFLILSEDTKNGNLYAALSGLCFGLAFLTKQTSALLIPAIAVIYLLATKRSLRFLFTKRFALFLGVAALIFAPWLIYMNFRFGYDFWNIYFLYSTFTRAASSIEGHAGGFLYYFNYLATSENLLWAVLLPFAVGVSAYFALKRSKADTLIVAWVAIVLLVFSVAQTKIYYYILPAYPAFALAIGALLYKTANKTRQLLSARKKAASP